MSAASYAEINPKRRQIKYINPQSQLDIHCIPYFDPPRELIRPLYSA